MQEKNFLWLKKYPGYLAWDMEIPSRPAYDILEKACTQTPHKNALNFLGKKTTYGELRHLVDRGAKGLQALGVTKGTKVGLFMPNCPYFVIFYYAILKAGGIVVNYNPLYVEKEIAAQVKDSQTEIMVTLDLTILVNKLLSLTEQKIILCSMADALPPLKKILFRLFKSKDVYKYTPSSRLIPGAQVMDNDGTYHAHPINPLEDLGVLQFTGGTTGVPKGAMLTHANIYANACQAEAWFQQLTTDHDKILAGLPLFHVFAMTAVMNLAMKTGAEIIMIFPRFSVEEAMRLIQKHRVTFFPAVPTIYSMISHHPKVKSFKLDSLVACLSGGAGLPLEVKHQFESLTGCHLIEAYGLSETSPAVTSNPLVGENKEGSIGIPFPGTEVRIVSLDDPMQPVNAGEKGQIAIKGPQVMKGYWNRPEETAAVFANGYLLTGDVGYMDEDGYTFLVDRMKDLIICSGFNVYPRVVEEAIYTHSAVREVTVIGVPDEKRGETVKAFIALNEGETCTVEQMLAYLHDKLSPIEMPKFIEFRETLPKTMIGKLSKKELKDEERKKGQHA